MDPFQGVSVEIISNNRPLPIYDDPEESEDTNQSTPSNVRQHYTEANTGAEFSVNVTLDKGFDLRGLGAEGMISILMQIDGISEQRKTYSREDLKRKLQRGSSSTASFSSTRHFDHQQKTWRRHRFTFTNLNKGRRSRSPHIRMADYRLEETSASTITVDRAKTLGCIEIQVGRVTRQPLHVPQARRTDAYPHVTEVSEKALKGRDIENTVG